MNNETLPVLIKVPVRCTLFWNVERLITTSVTANGLTYRFTDAGCPSGLLQVTLTEKDLVGLYPHLPTAILNAQIAQFANQEIGLLFVTGPNAISVVRDLKGSENDPDLCASGTWRHEIGKILGVRRMTLRGPDGQPGITVYDNFVHAPKQGDEVGSNMKVLRRFYPREEDLG